jgi:hypothetical protein
MADETCKSLLIHDLAQLLVPFVRDGSLTSPIHCTIIGSNGAGFVLQYQVSPDGYGAVDLRATTYTFHPLTEEVAEGVSETEADGR